MSERELSRQALAQLRHQLRTPLNHVIGYCEILMEDAEASGSVESTQLLNSIHKHARQVLECVLGSLATPECDLRILRENMLEPVQAIMRAVGTLVQSAGSSDLLDLLRINSAASELLAFALGQAPKSTPAASVSETAAPAAPLAATVLLVDDDESNRDILRRQLERLGCSVNTADNGDTALRLIASSRFDVVLLDVIMPKLNGVETLQQIHAYGETSPSVIMISALDEMDSVRKSLELGAEDYLLKPFDPVVLRARLAATLERRRLRMIERQRTGALEIALKQLQEVNEDLQQFAYAASHDLQSPIRTVTSMSQLLERRYKGKLDGDADQLIGNITMSMRRMSELVQDLLAYSRVASDDTTLDRLSLDEALNIAIANLEEQIRATDAVIECDRLPGVHGRRTHFVQIFQNLIGNAIKYRAKRRPHVRISFERDAESCIIHVSDNGVGFDSEYARQIFEPFKRLHGHEYPGSGIGLAICARAVRQYGGRIWAESEPGRGSRFSFTIPSNICHTVDERPGASREISADGTTALRPSA